MDKNVGRLNMVSRTIREQIATQEPRVSDVSVDIDMGERSGVLIFNIDYTIAATNTRDNLVFPFYLNVTEEEEEEGEPEIYEPETVEEFGN
jgi:predicted component of type VI protein secretion system